MNPRDRGEGRTRSSIDITPMRVGGDQKLTLLGENAGSPFELPGIYTRGTVVVIDEVHTDSWGTRRETVTKRRSKGMH